MSYSANTSTPKPILFFSPQCQHSVQLWKYLKQKNLLDTINKINVSKCKQLPNSITSVPTLIIKNRPPIVGEAIMFYFNTVSPTESRTTLPNPRSRQASHNTASSGHTEAPTLHSGPIRDFMPGEMGSSWSDGYSFLENNKPIDHSYAYIDSKASSGIPSKDEFDLIQMQKCNSRTGGKKRNGDLNHKLEEYKKNRTINI